MPRQGQIIPEYLVPHVQTYINDNSVFEDFTANPSDDGVRLLCVFASAKGEDGVIKVIDNPADYIEEYGTPNYNLYGQPCYMPYAALNSGYAKCLCMRIMPSDAAYANLVVLAKVKTDEDTKAVKVKFSSVALNDLTDGDSLGLRVDALTMESPTVDDEGYSVYPIFGVRSKGRGAYGNSLRFRVTADKLSDAENDFKNYIFEVLDSDGGLSKKGTYRGTLISTATISRESVFAEDVINDIDTGSEKVEVYFNSAALDSLYNLYLAQVQEDETPVPMNEFDFIGALTKSNEAIPHYELEEGSIALDRLDGILMSSGTDGSFSTEPPAPKTTVADEAAMLALTTTDVAIGDIIKVSDTNTYYKVVDTTDLTDINNYMVVTFDRDSVIEAEYIKAFNGEEPYDPAIKSKRRAPAELILDANYPAEVKKAMAGLALARYDARCVMDAGILYTVKQAITWADEVSSISDRIISKECQHYKIKDPFNGKTIPVTATYFIASYLPAHYKVFGNHVPFVGEGYAKLTGYVKNSLKPVLDADDLKNKDELYQKRVNFFECIAEDSFVRGVQGTSQMVWSDLSEENNVAVMLEMKRKLEEFVASKIYNFAEPEDRKRFTEDADRMFTDYSNKKVRSYKVYFDMNKFEEERSILHCYLELVFKTMAKRGIIEIDINKRV